MEGTLINFLYLICVVLFIVGLKRLSSPDTARNGNVIAASGMGLGILVTLVYPMEGAHNNYLWIVLGLILGSVIGLVAAKNLARGQSRISCGGATVWHRQ